MSFGFVIRAVPGWLAGAGQAVETRERASSYQKKQRSNSQCSQTGSRDFGAPSQDEHLPENIRDDDVIILRSEAVRFQEVMQGVPSETHRC
jgi:hypothetical protein